MRVLAVKAQLLPNASKLIHIAWEGRRRNPLRWWCVKAGFGIKPEIIDTKTPGGEKITIVLSREKAAQWRARHGKA